MGQKVNPNGFRTGINKDWRATWSAPKKDIASVILEDHKIRRFITDNYGIRAGMNNCFVSKVTIERRNSLVIVNIFTGRPGMLIGQKGSGIEVIKKELQKIVGAKTLELNVREVKNADIDADLVAQSIATQLEKRVAWRRTMKMAIQKAMKCGITGINVMLSGRLDGADIARSEHYHQGVLPLHTLRSDIDYGFAEAKTTFGIIGVKCWICNGEIKGKKVRTGEVVRSVKERSERPRREWTPRPPREGGDYTAKRYDGGEKRELNPTKNSGGFSKSFIPKSTPKKEDEGGNGNVNA
jgi:small subunit ribosomal protein S3